MKFLAKVYCVGKGNKSQDAYFATMIQEEYEKLGVKARDALLVNLTNKTFPVVIRTHSTMLGFTIPYRIGVHLPLKRNIEFKVSERALELNKQTNEKNKISLSNIIPSKTIRDHPIHLFDMNEKLLIWIHSRGNRPHILPKQISIEECQYNRNSSL